MAFRGGELNVPATDTFSRKYKTKKELKNGKHFLQSLSTKNKEAKKFHARPSRAVWKRLAPLIDN